MQAVERPDTAWTRRTPAKRFQLFTEDAGLRATVVDGLSAWNPVDWMLGDRLREAGAGGRPDVLIVDLAHPLAEVLVASLRRMSDPPALVGIAAGFVPIALPFAVVPQPIDAAVLAFSVRCALAAAPRVAEPRRAPAPTPAEAPVAALAVR